MGVAEAAAGVDDLGVGGLGGDELGRCMKHLLKPSTSTKLKALQDLVDAVKGTGEGWGARQRPRDDLARDRASRRARRRLLPVFTKFSFLPVQREGGSLPFASLSVSLPRRVLFMRTLNASITRDPRCVRAALLGRRYARSAEELTAVLPQWAQVYKRLLVDNAQPVRASAARALRRARDHLWPHPFPCRRAREIGRHL